MTQETDQVIEASKLESVGWVGNTQYVRVRGEKSRAELIMGREFDGESGSVPPGRVLVRFTKRSSTGRTFDKYRTAQPVEAGRVRRGRGEGRSGAR